MIRDSFLVVNKDVSKGFVVHILSRFNAAVTAPGNSTGVSWFSLCCWFGCLFKMCERFNGCYSRG